MDSLDAGPRTAAARAPGAAEKALLLLECLTRLSAAGVPPTLTSLVTASGLAKSTTHRLLSLLVRRGLVTYADGAYRPGPALADLAAGALGLPVGRLRATLLPHMVDLYELTHETVSLAVLQGRDVVLVERVHGSRKPRASFRLPERVPAHSTALGRALLDAADPFATAPSVATPSVAGARGDHTGIVLSEVRRQGVSTSLGELIPGVACLAVPVLDEARNPVMALSVSGRVRSMDLLAVAKHLRSVSLAACLALLTEER
ncbi:IclR family transcriptional regulator [Streptomyces scopuliridis]|uniref:IclR family transcriptional regulator n=1 Tax=Streptomyces scopuliridis TaxID=452529 RepID=UPI00367D9FD9